jgi:hypothetical protein
MVLSKPTILIYNMWDIIRLINYLPIDITWIVYLPNNRDMCLCLFIDTRSLMIYTQSLVSCNGATAVLILLIFDSRTLSHKVSSQLKWSEMKTTNYRYVHLNWRIKFWQLRFYNNISFIWIYMFYYWCHRSFKVENIKLK